MKYSRLYVSQSVTSANLLSMPAVDEFDEIYLEGWDVWLGNHTLVVIWIMMQTQEFFLPLHCKCNSINLANNSKICQQILTKSFCKVGCLKNLQQIF